MWNFVDKLFVKGYKSVDNFIFPLEREVINKGGKQVIDRVLITDNICDKLLNFKCFAFVDSC